MRINEPGKESGKMKLIVIFAAAAVLLVAGGLFAYGRLAATTEVSDPGEGVGATNGGPLLKINEITTNLKGEPIHFIQVQIELEGKDAQAIKEIERRSVQVQDAIIGVLRSRTLMDVSGEGGMRRLAADILSRIETVLGMKIIKNLYFTKFVVQ